MCFIGLHDWEISKWAVFKGKSNNISEQGFDRTCQVCNKEQRLQRTKKYHPNKYVWAKL